MNEMIVGFQFGVGAMIAIWLMMKVIDYFEETWRELSFLLKRVGRK